MSEKQVKAKTVAKPKEKRIKGTTKSGFKYDIPEENINNYELMEVLGDIEENPLVLSKAVTLLLGKDLREALKEHIRTDTGIVPTDKMMEELEEIMTSQKEIKKS